MSDLIKTLKSSETGDNVYPNIKPDNIPSGAVTTAKLDDSAVTTIKLNDGAVTTAKISDGAVTSAKIGSSAVTNAKINDGAVSYDKLASALKNLIDGKASQTDLETLQTAVNDKQDNIDATHKLDADLVDDSTSTNKFTTASNLSKLSGIESGAEVNTIETISVNGTPVTPDANRNVNIATGGGIALYRHRIHITGDASTGGNFYLYLDIYNTNNIQLTLQDIISLSTSAELPILNGYENQDYYGIFAIQYNTSSQNFDLYTYDDNSYTGENINFTDTITQIL